VNEGHLWDYLILGAGPAGLQLAYFLQQSGRDYLVLEAGEGPGTFFTKFPRHRTLISSNKVHTGFTDPERNLRWDWNSLLCDEPKLLLKHYTTRYFPDADVLVRYLRDFAVHYRLNIRCNAHAARISRSGEDGFRVEESSGVVHHCRRLVIATGVSQPYVPPIPGVELAERYGEVSIDPCDFVNQRVLIIGKGNSAFETADNLAESAAIIHLASPHSVQMAWKTHFVGHLRAVNNNMLDTYQLKSQNAILDCHIDAIERAGERYKVSVSYQHAHGEQEELYYDRVILCTGFRFGSSLFDADCRPELAINDRFPRQTSAWESTNVPGLYFAGTLTQQRDFKKMTSGFIHGFRYNTQALYRILERRYHGVDWPCRLLPRDAEAITNAVIERANRSSALWQQFGFLADMLAVRAGDAQVRYFEDVPVAYAHESDLVRDSDYYLLTLEYGDFHDLDLINPKGNYRPERHDVANAHLSPALHPILRRYWPGGELVSVHHVLEDLYGEWLEEVHTEPLLAYFRREESLVPAMVL
jgi:thioredoxin reductase